MLNKILIDVIEMIVCCSKNYEVYEQVRSLIVKLDNFHVKSRILYSFTDMKKQDTVMMYAIKTFNGEYYHNSFDRPCFIHATCGDHMYKFYNNKDNRLNKLPYKISITKRYYQISLDNKIKYLRICSGYHSFSKIYDFNNKYIYNDGTIYYNGCWFDVFDYIKLKCESSANQV